MEAMKMEVTTHAPGTFCWVELAAVDAQSAKFFYTQLFDWAIEENDMGNGQVYTMYRHDGRYVAAQYQMSEEEQKQVGKSHWLNYISTNDVKESARVAAESGGTVLAGPLDVGENGRLAVVQDPTGAIFALWEAKSHSGIEKAYEPGSLGWSELVTKNVNTAGAFYTNPSRLGYTGAEDGYGRIYGLPAGQGAGGRHGGDDGGMGGCAVALDVLLRCCRLRCHS